MSSSKDRVIVPAAFPADAIQTTTNKLLPYAISEEERKAIIAITSLAIPPPNLQIILRVSTTLCELGIFNSLDHKTLTAFANRNKNCTDLMERWPHISFPICPVILQLKRKSESHDKMPTPFIRELISLAQEHPPREKYTGHMYYKHIIAYRDVCVLYWRNENVCNADEPIQGMKDYIKKTLNGSLHSKHTKTKLLYTTALINRELLLGGAWPRQSSDRNSSQCIGSKISVDQRVQESIALVEQVQSAVGSTPI